MSYAGYKVMETAAITHSSAMRNYLAFMGPRLALMHRALKPTGSLFLHCDQYADSYLQLLLDAIMGNQNYLNTVVWVYNPRANSRKRFPRKHDVLHFYAKDEKENRFFPQYREYTEQEKQIRFQDYRYFDENGQRYRTTRWKSQADGNVQKRVYWKDNKGYPVPSWWSDIPPLTGRNKEKTGYPTQKPLRLLERIIGATTEPGDLVLDPFCGCATTCVAAERLDRRWIGIDVSAHAAYLVIQRLLKEKVQLGPGGVRVNCNWSWSDIEGDVFAMVPTGR